MTNNIPSDHPIHRIWENNEKLRTLEGTLELANAGDKDAIATLMGNFVMKTENGRAPSPEIMAWIADAFVRILNREPAGVAFGLRPGHGGKKPEAGYQSLEKKAHVANHIIARYDPAVRGSLKQARESAMEEFGVSESYAQKAYDLYKL